MKRNAFKKSIGAAALLLFGLAPVANADNLTLQDDGNGGYYLNIPATEDVYGFVPEGVTSFKIYDDGGETGNYSAGANGSAAVYAPPGYELQVKGDLDLCDAIFSISDFDVALYSKSCTGKCEAEIESFTAARPTFVLAANSGCDAQKGVALDVSLVKLTENAEQANLSSGKSIDLPKYGAKTLTVPDGISSFKVYDDGGRDGGYSNYANGCLVISAPGADQKLLLTGTMVAERLPYDHLTVFDGDVGAKKLLNAVGCVGSGSKYDVGMVSSSGNTMTICFYSDGGGSYKGLDLDVSVFDGVLTPQNINVAQVTGGNTKVYVSSDEVTSALAGTVVEVSVELDEGYLLQDLEVEDKNGSHLEVNKGDWPLSYNASFLMPNAEVTVKPIIVKTSDIFVTMPLTGEKEVRIPWGVSSFHIYSDGGKDGTYGKNAKGTLKLRASSGYVLQVTGTVTTEAGEDYLTIYDGSGKTRIVGQVSSLSDGVAFDVGTLVSMGNYMELYFVSDGSDINYAGLDLVVTVVSPTPHDIIVKTLENGTLKGDMNGVYPGKDVLLTVVPDDGYIVNEVEAFDEWGNSLDVSFLPWLVSNEFSLKMPSSDVNLSVTLVPIKDFFINMPSSGGFSGIIPNEITSFKIYDNGGASGNCTSGASGSAELKAPPGYEFKVEGKVNLGNASFSISEDHGGYYYECNKNCNEKIEFTASRPNFALTTNSNCDTQEGIDLTVSLVKLTENAEQASLSSDNSINLPKNGAKKLTVPDGVSSFKVYDDGEGEDGNGMYSNLANGCLVVSASGTDQTLLLTGTALAEKKVYDHLTVFDGDVGAKKLLNAAGSESNSDLYDVGAVSSSGNTMTICFYSDASSSDEGLDLTVSVNSAVVFADADGKRTVVINGEYTGAEVVDIPKAVEVDAIDFKRELTPKVPATTMLPFTLPENATVNAEFYELTDVVEVDHSWRATMTNIKKLGYNLPKPNTPYAVILHEGESELKFDLKGQKAVVQTGEIQNQKNKAETWYFTSTYAFKDWGSSENSDEIGLVYAFSGINDKGVSKGVFGRVSTESTANPMRSYLRKKDESVMLQGVRGANGNTFASTYSINLMPETIDIEFIDSDANGKERTTAIGRMNPATGEIRLIHMDRTFDLKGRSVNREKKNARGAYYGKKVR